MGKIMSFLLGILRDRGHKDTGRLDVFCNPIHEGDEVLVYTTKGNLPMARGVVVWSQETSGYEVEYTWQCPEWENGAARTGMSGYLFKVITCDHGE